MALSARVSRIALLLIVLGLLGSSTVDAAKKKKAGPKKTKAKRSAEDVFEASSKEFDVVAKNIQVRDKSLRHFSGSINAKCADDGACQVPWGNNDEADLPQSADASLVKFTLREVANVTKLESLDAAAEKMDKSINVEALLLGPESIPVGPHCAANTASAKAAVLLKSSLHLPQHLITSGVVAMALGVYWPLVSADKIKAIVSAPRAVAAASTSTSVPPTTEASIDPVTGETVLQQEPVLEAAPQAAAAAAAAAVAATAVGVDDGGSEWLQAYLRDYGKMLEGEIAHLVSRIALERPPSSSSFSSSSSSSSSDDDFSSPFLSSSEPLEASVTKSLEWKKRLQKLSGAQSKMLKLLQARGPANEAVVQREAVVLRYIAEDLLTDIASELELISSSSSSSSSASSASSSPSLSSSSSSSVQLQRFPYVVAYAWAFRAELEARQILNEAADAAKSLDKLAKFVNKEAHTLLLSSPTTLYSVGVELAPMLARYSMASDVAAAQAREELPVFAAKALKDPNAGNKLLLPRASDALVWADELDAMRYLYSQRTSVDPLGSIALNRVDTMIWYCDFINVALEDCEVGRESVDISSLFTKLGGQAEAPSSHGGDSMASDSDGADAATARRRLLDLSILQGVTLPAFRLWVESSLNARFGWSGPQHVHIVDGSLVAEAQALMELFAATGGNAWSRREGWGSSLPLGQWFGVSTDVNGHVTKLSLAGNNLRGPLPEALASQLSSLTHLDLSVNALTGPLPSSLSLVSGLDQLRLQSNQLNGPVPEDLSALGKLTALWLAGNAFTGPVPVDSLAQLSSLRFLDLSDNALEEVEEARASLEAYMPRCDVAL